MGNLSLISLELECEFLSQNETIPKSWGVHTQAEGLAEFCVHKYSF